MRAMKWRHRTWYVGPFYGHWSNPWSFGFGLLAGTWLVGVSQNAKRGELGLKLRIERVP